MTHDAKSLRDGCTRFLSHHRPRDAAAILRHLAASPHAVDATDSYADGGAVARLEARVANLLGQPAALFFSKGTLAQMSILAAHADRRGSRKVVVHPASHIDIDEANAIEHLAGLQPVRLGRHQPFTAAMLDTVAERVAAVVVELPLRRPGYLLPPIDDLRAIAAWCRAHDAALHLDGARLWESAAGYGVDLPVLAALADTTYVSFYKGLGGLGGAAVAGPADLLAQARVWRHRHGAAPYTSFPDAIAALDGLDTQLSRIGDYVARARDLAARLRAVAGVRLQPETPHVNAFQLWFPGSPAELVERHARFARDRRIWLFNGFAEAPLTGWSMAELVVLGASDEWSIDEATRWIADFADPSIDV